MNPLSAVFKPTQERLGREQPSSYEILKKLDQVHNLTKSSLPEDIALTKIAVNQTVTQSSARLPTWAEKVRSGGPPSHPPTPPISSPSSAVSKDREIIIKLDSPELTTLPSEKIRGSTNKDQRYPATTKPQLQGACRGSRELEEWAHISVYSKHSRRKPAQRTITSIGKGAGKRSQGPQTPHMEYSRTGYERIKRA